MLLELLYSDTRVVPSLLFGLRAVLLDAEGDAREPAEVRIALARFSEEGQMRAAAVGFEDRHLEAGDRPQAGLSGCASELHRPEHALVVRQRERAVALSDGGVHELIDARGAFEQ